MEQQMRFHTEPSSSSVLSSALASARHTTGSTHNFYLYPARFSPEAAAAIIWTYSHREDWILDPFMGGGTAVVEALMAGRRTMGVDLNALGHFVATVRTTPLSDNDRFSIRMWAAAAQSHGQNRCERISILNLPKAVTSFMQKAIVHIAELPFRRQRSFARCALLRLGQRVLDCRDHAAHDKKHLAKLPQLVDEMLSGLQHFVKQCGEAGISKNEITSRRLLLVGDARHAVNRTLCRRKGIRPSLVMTSPPYAKVHVLYHRWQVRGRSETPAPYWIADVPDGYYASHYTGGSRTPTGERSYFQMIQEVFSSLRAVIHPDATVAQLVGFANARKQLPLYLQAMRRAGYEEELPTANGRLWRLVPNRKWHARLQGALDASSEVLLIHHPIQKSRG